MRNHRKPTRRAAIATVAAAPLAFSKSRRPNFLFILADDHAGYVMGCDGNRLALTPHIDRLAREGIRFSAHHCNSPVCTPSRQALLTGQLPHAAGVTVLGTPLALDKPTLARQFQQAGYRTAVFGKMHFNRLPFPECTASTSAKLKNESPVIGPRPTPKPRRRGFARSPRGGPSKTPPESGSTPIGSPSLPSNRACAELIWRIRQSNTWGSSRVTSPSRCGSVFRNPTLRKISRWKTAPRFDPATFPVPRVGPDDASQIPLVFRDLSSAGKQGIIASYYTSVGFLDRNVGRVLEAVRRLGLDQDTFVVYTADHGYCLGQHGRFEKHCGYEPALRVPLIVGFPGRIHAGRVVSDLTEHVDVPATVVDMLDLAPLPDQHGQSLRPYLEGRFPPHRRDHIFSEYLENEEAFIKTKKWKYIYCSGKRPRQDGYQTDRPTPGSYQRLYDLTYDPGELNDVSLAHPVLVDRFQNLMLDRFRATHPGHKSEPPGLERAHALDFYLTPRDAPPFPGVQA